MSEISKEQGDIVQHKNEHVSPEICNTSGKVQPWRSAWPPSVKNQTVKPVSEAKGELLLLDGTGGSGTVAVPNAVYLPPKDMESAKKD